ncbi:MAG: peptidase M75 [Bacteroidales bacterium]|nr:peptidase M75 [Bacteroidales bacterium]
MKVTKHILCVALASATLALAACNNGKEENTNDMSAINSAASQVAAKFVDKTVGPTYSSLAASAEQLASQLATFRDDPTQANLDAACETFLVARSWWEKSEAFLFGIATAEGIDPHIDSWPLDADAFNETMRTPGLMARLAGEDGDLAAGELDKTLLGFHGIEYVIWRNGEHRQVADIDSLSRIYVAAVAGDLRNRCYQLEVGWLGNSAPAAHRALFEEGGRLEELSVTVLQGSYSYGENLKNAGKAGSTYVTPLAAVMAIIDGCKTIADEVGTSKIGKPAGIDAETADTSYIESPYSQKSIDDFVDNFRSIQNVWYGGVEGNRDANNSLQTFVKNNVDEKLATRVTEAIDDAIAKIDDMTRPFVQNYTSEKCKTAITACQNVDAIFSEVNNAIDEL